MHNVNVGWGDHAVLRNLNWTLRRGEHWLLRGPNGSGKTTFLELITGDNMQVFSNDIKIFGNRRGSGESIWDIKKRLGIVSYRIHVEYRMIGGISLQDVVISGFYDSIGLYEKATLNHLGFMFKGKKKDFFLQPLNYPQSDYTHLFRNA